MSWVIVPDGRILCRGSREACLCAGERVGAIACAFHADGTELAPSIERTAVLLPERMLPARLRRRAA
ncbi:hypothetical protein QO001_002222 [Methylobacterium brachiatum]|uniref:Uncharacterized protein n=1 Tax=Methylobacterium brachiatum TaxID=269660 RepID=A0AAJ1TM85_9HYPH|nr:hypothetical protein [Methylobacterium brachiatum]MCB4802669.1 hypothetical protein [Methylobacterium brachiatum]MDQ0543296.1 hypothetical protein [Methylobacterium brachiatum]